IVSDCQRAWSGPFMALVVSRGKRRKTRSARCRRRSSCDGTRPEKREQGRSCAAGIKAGVAVPARVLSILPMPRYSELRRRVREAILSHIDPKRWAKLQAVERLEQATLDSVMAKLASAV